MRHTDHHHDSLIYMQREKERILTTYFGAGLGVLILGVYAVCAMNLSVTALIASVATVAALSLGCSATGWLLARRIKVPVSVKHRD